MSRAALITVTLSAATVGRPFVNRSRHAGEELAYAAYLDLEAGRNENGVALFEEAFYHGNRAAAEVLALRSHDQI